jgi:hypothetical protein
MADPVSLWRKALFFSKQGKILLFSPEGKPRLSFFHRRRTNVPFWLTRRKQRCFGGRQLRRRHLYFAAPRRAAPSGNPAAAVSMDAARPASGARPTARRGRATGAPTSASAAPAAARISAALRGRDGRACPPPRAPLRLPRCAQPCALPGRQQLPLMLGCGRREHAAYLPLPLPRRRRGRAPSARQDLTRKPVDRNLLPLFPL